ncbi:hypothetical protein BJX99DRAFT_254463 [Aspergillus californicus]
MPLDLGQTSSADHARKRTRPVVSCLRCREKKLKCDRVTPCENCIKAGCPTGCAFQDGLGNAPKRVRLESGAMSTDSSDRNLTLRSDTGLGIIEDLQQRVRRMEDLFSIRSEAQLAGTNGMVLDRADAPEVAPPLSARPYLGTLGVKGSRTRYHGHNHRISLLRQCEEARNFLVKNCSNGTPILRLFKEIQFIQRKSGRSVNSSESVSEPDSSELEELKRSLPPRNVCDLLVDLYTANFEQTFRILHVPTFRRQYAEFWNDVNGGDQLPLALVPQLTAVLAISLSLVDEGFKRSNSDICDYLHSPAVHLVRAWLQKLSRKQRTDYSILQTEVLVTLARQLSGEQPEDTWQATSSLVRTAMVMGLHLDLSNYTNLSAFQRELRRRLWITVVEMELQSSIAAGMPSTIPDIDFGPLTPTNINDSDYDESMIELPPGRPLSEMTDALAQIVLAGSLSIRVQAISLVQKGPLREATPSSLGQELKGFLQQIPPVLKIAPSPQPTDTPANWLTRVLLDLYIRRPLLFLHRLEIKQDCPMPACLNACLESSLSILSYLDYFDPTVSDLDSSNLTAYWNMLHRFCANDILQAALSVCDYMKRAPSPWPTHTKASLSRTVENALDGLTRTIDQPGSNMKDVLLLSVVLQQVRARGSDETRTQQVRQGVMKVLSACRQHLLSSWTEYPFDHVAGHVSVPPTGPTVLPTVDGAYTPNSLPFPDLTDYSALATEFSHFMDGPLDFDDGSFGDFFANF